MQTRKFTVKILYGSEEITSFICLTAKTSTQICCKPLKGNGGCSPANQCKHVCFWGKHGKKNPNPHSFTPPPVMCVFMTMLLIVSFSKAGSLPPTADAEMIPGNLFMVALREHNRGY